MGPMKILDTLNVKDIVSATKNKKYAFFYLYDEYDSNSLQMLPKLLDDLDFITGEIPFFTCYEEAFITNENISSLIKDEIIHTQINQDIDWSFKKMKYLADKFKCKKLPSLVVLNIDNSTCSKYDIKNVSNPLVEISIIVDKYKKNLGISIDTINENQNVLDLNDLLNTPLPNDKKESFIKTISRYIYKEPRDGDKLFQKFYDEYFDKGIENCKDFCERINISESSLSKLYTGNYTKKPGVELLLKCSDEFGLTKEQTNELLIAYGHSPIEDEIISPLNNALNDKYIKGKKLLIGYFNMLDISDAKFCIKNGLNKATVSRMRNENSNIIPTRSNIIKCAIGFKLTLSQTDELLKLYGYSPLYSDNSMDKKDQIIAAGIKQGLSYNIILEIIKQNTEYNDV